MNVTRWLIGGFVAGILCFFGDGIIHGAILPADWEANLTALGFDTKGQDQGQSMLYFAIYDLAKGFAAAWIYVAIRPRYGAGPRTAVLASLLAWATCCVIPNITWLAIPIFPSDFVVKWAFLELGPVLAGGVAAAAIYKEAAPASTAG